MLRLVLALGECFHGSCEVINSQLLGSTVGLLLLLVGRYFICSEVLSVSVTISDLVEIIMRKIFNHLSFIMFVIKLLANDRTDWVNLLGF